MDKEIIIDHREIEDSQTITPVMVNKFKERGLDIHRHEVRDLEDDHDRKVRKLRVVSKQYFAVGDVPWHRSSSQDRPEASSSETIDKGEANE